MQRLIRRLILEATFPFLMFTSTSMASETTILLEDELVKAKIKFLRDGVRVESLWDKKENVELINLKNNSRLFDLTLDKAEGGREEIVGNFGWTKVAPINALPKAVKIIQEKQFGDEYLKVVVNLRVEGGKLHANYELEIPPNISVFSLKALPIFFGPLGNASDDDLLHYPNGSGIVTKALYDSGESYKLKYPTGRQAYQMMGLYDEKTGIYFAAHDPVGIHKSLSYTFYKGGGGLKFYAEYFAGDYTKPGNSQAFKFDTVVGVQHGDWYDAAMVYREFVKKKARWWPNRNLAFWKERPGIYNAAFWLAVVGRYTNVVNKTLKVRELMGVPIGAHWYTWSPWGMDSNYPNFFPPHDGFGEAIEDLQSKEVTVMPYILARLWDTKLESYDEKAISAAIKQPDGSPALVISEIARFAVMCPTQLYWQSIIKDVTERLFTEYHADGIYIDQVAAAAPTPCYDPTHGHPLGGGSHWIDGYQTMIEGIRSRSAPHKYLTSEMNAEPYMHLFEGYLNWWWVFPDQQPIYQAIYGGQYLSFGRSHDHDDEIAVVTKAAQQLVFGEQIGWFFGDPTQNFPAAMPFLVDASRTYYQLREYFAGGRMLRPLNTAEILPQVKAQWHWRTMNDVYLPAILNGVWQAEDGRVAAIFVNSSDKMQTARFKRGQLGESYLRKTLTSLDANLSINGEMIEVTLPPRGIGVLEYAASN